jgi:hypothetical protein
MPVDRRVREGLHRNADVVDPRTESALDRSLARGTRRRRTRRLGGVAVAVLVLAVVVGAGVPSLLRRADRPAPAAGMGPADLAALQGTWTTGTLRAGDVAADLEAAGVAACGAELLGDAQELTWILTVEGSTFTVSFRPDAAAPVEDRAGFIESLGDGTIRLTEPDGPATAMFDAATDGRRLTLELADVRTAGDDTDCELRAEALAQLGHPLTRVG